MSESNLFEFMDDILYRFINPAKINPYPLHESQRADRVFMIQSEGSRVLDAVKEKIRFSPHPAQQLTIYHNKVVELMNQAFQIRQSNLFSHSNLDEALKAMDQVLEEMMTWIMSNNRYILTETLYYPQSQLIGIRTQIEKVIHHLVEKTKAGWSDAGFPVLKQVLASFINRIKDQEPITRQEVDYHEWLLGNVYKFYLNANTLNIPPSLSEQFILWNLNSDDVRSFLEVDLDHMLDTMTADAQRLAYLQVHYRTLKKKSKKAAYSYDPNVPPLEVSLLAYYKNEIDYLDHPVADNNGIIPGASQVQNDDLLNIVCNLSVDQVGIILRSGKEAEVLEARSIDAIFKALSKYLSTRQTKHISWRSMRNKASSPEARDKDIAIEALERIIEKIRES